jgi:predicted transglutaminase-like cysteine proteinase
MIVNLQTTFFWRFLLLLLCAIQGSAAFSQELKEGHFLQEYGPSAVPNGFSSTYCYFGNKICADRQIPEKLRLNDEMWRGISRINETVNDTIEKSEGQNEYEFNKTLAIEKAKHLEKALQIADANLLITTVLKNDGWNHVVLTIVTIDGEFVLDGLDNKIEHWQKLKYVFTSRQSQKNGGRWVALQKPTLKAQEPIRYTQASRVVTTTSNNAEQCSAAVKQNLKTPSMPLCGPTLPPLGYVECMRDNRCVEFRNSFEPMTKSEWEKLEVNYKKINFKDKKKILEKINQRVNRAIEPITDKMQYAKSEFWTVPKSLAKGDCEDYALMKQQELFDLGIPHHDLLIAVALDETSNGHAVLVAVTDEGDFVLDNRRDEILIWHEAGYRYLKRQSRKNQRHWLAITDDLSASVDELITKSFLAH